LFPEGLEYWRWWIAWLAVVGIVYGAAIALVQDDFKFIIGYSSVSHMGFVLLGVFAFNEWARQGAIVQMLAHGLSTGALFLIVGILYERSHTRLIKDFGGVSSRMPVFSVFFLLAMLSSVGLPGLNGFVGEILCLFGIFQSNRTLAILAVSTVILAAAYLLWMYQRVMHGPVVHERVRALPDMNTREIIYLVPIVVLMFWMGIHPSTFMRKMDASIASYLQLIQSKQTVYVQGRPASPTSADKVTGFRKTRKAEGSPISEHWEGGPASGGTAEVPVSVGQSRSF